MSDWCPFAERVGPSFATSAHVTGYPARGVLHTTESDRYAPRSSDYFGHQSWPHMTITGGGIWQHLPADRSARAMKNAPGGVETNRANAFQIEVVARAAKPDWPDDLLDNVRRAMRWAEDELGIKREAPRFVGYPASYGVNAPQRFTQSEWRRFNGWCGHQHVPENDHGDPGAIAIGALLEDDMPLSKDDVELIFRHRISEGGDGVPDYFGNYLFHLWKRQDEIVAKLDDLARAIADREKS